MSVDDLSDHVGRLVAIERRVQYLNLQVGLLLRPAPEMRFDAGGYALRITPDVLVGLLPAEVDQDLLEGVGHGLPHGVIAAIGGRVRFEVLDRDGRPKEDEVVVEIGPVQNFAGHRIEEGFGQLGLLMLCEQSDVLELHLLPGAMRQFIGVEFPSQARYRFVHTGIEEMDALLDRLLYRGPITRVESVFRPGAGLTEQSIVLIKALDHPHRNGERGALRRDLRQRIVHILGDSDRQRLPWIRHGECNSSIGMTPISFRAPTVGLSASGWKFVSR